jgi:tetratricopeptide (TPR) repeat protein
MSTFHAGPGRGLAAVVSLLATLVLAAPAARGEQYQSEVRELPGTPAPAQKLDPKKALKDATDPYARALLLRDLAAQAVGRKEYEQAAEYLEQALAEGALSPQAATQMRRDLTALRVAGGKPADVVKALEPRVKDNPQASAEERAALGAAYVQLKRYRDALPLLQKAVASTANPEEGWLQALYAAYVGAGQDKDALPVLEKLVRRNPGRREYWLQLSGLYHKSGQKERALAALELASRQGHLESAEERLQLVGLTAQLGTPFEAGSLMHSWMESGQIPKTAGNLEMLAGLWVAAREPTLAIDALRAVVDERPRPELWAQLGQLLMDQDQNTDAALALARAATAGRPGGGPPPGDLLLALGAASYNAGNPDGAVEAFAGAARQKGSAAAAQQWLKFLELPQAQALAGKFGRGAPTPREEVALSGRLLGGTVSARPLTGEIPGAMPDLRQISGRLTPVGAERDANADGSIPEWTGGLTAAPKAFKPGGRLADPFADDKPLFTITAANAAQYASKLGFGHRTLLANHPSYRMPVYATRRTAAYPQAIYEATAANLGKSKLVGSDGLTGARLGFPFPQPLNGVEAMWNHRVRYRGNSLEAQYSQAVVRANGEVASQSIQKVQVLFRYGNTEQPSNLAEDNVLLYFLGRYFTPSNTLNFVVLVHETANVEKGARGIWVIPPSVPKMFRIPPVGYDQPYPGSEAIYFVDMLDMYNGAFDRYVWKLVGKRELYIPYNAYRLNDGSLKYAQLLTAKHLNPEATRYELHRVWMIEAVERGGKRHSFGKRIFYLDEDSWNVVMVDNFDREGRPWRFQEGHLLPNYEVLMVNAAPTVTYDLKDGRYFAINLSSEDPPVKFNAALQKRDFTPANVKARNIQ